MPPRVARAARADARSRVSLHVVRKRAVPPRLALAARADARSRTHLGSRCPAASAQPCPSCSIPSCDCCQRWHERGSARGERGALGHGASDGMVATGRERRLRCGQAKGTAGRMWERACKGNHGRMWERGRQGTPGVLRACAQCAGTAGRSGSERT